MRLSLVTLITLAAGSIMLRADVLQSTVVLPPPTGQYTVPEICISTGCTVNATLDNFVVASSTQSGGDQLEVVDARYRSDVYTNSGAQRRTSRDAPGLSLLAGAGRFHLFRS